MGNGRSVRLVPSRWPFLSVLPEPSPGERNGRCSRTGFARGSSDARARLPRTARRGSPQSRPPRASSPRCRRRRSSPRRRGAAAHRDRRSPSGSSSRCRCLDGSAWLDRGSGRRTRAARGTRFAPDPISPWQGRTCPLRSTGRRSSSLRSPARQYSILRAMGVLATVASPAQLNAADLVVDALLGYSQAGAPRGETATLIGAAAGRRVLALDVPSGLELETGTLHGPHVRAETTLTLALPKRVFARGLRSASSCSPTSRFPRACTSASGLPRLPSSERARSCGSQKADESACVIDAVSRAGLPRRPRSLPSVAGGPAFGMVLRTPTPVRETVTS
jgi:hypothetical protein